MAALAVDYDAKLIRRRHDRAAAHAKGPGRKKGPDVDAKDRGRFQSAVECAFRQHRVGAASALFAGLKDQADGSGERLAAFGEQASGAHQHRHVRVVSAGVHKAGDIGAVRPAGGLLHRQGVHVGAQSDRFGRFAGQIRDDAGLPDSRADGKTQGLQLRRGQGGRLLFRERGLRMAMDRPAPFDELRREALGLGSESC